MERALRETESSAYFGRRLRSTAGKSSRAAFSLSRKSQRNTPSVRSRAISKKSSREKSCLRIDFKALFVLNFRYVKRRLFPPILKAICISLIVFYQKKLSRHTCLYEPTCSEYTKRCINNLGTIPGIILGAWRILRCNPLSKGGIDPAPENPFRKRWLI